tara:strand:+ start:4347 stop:5036 length:690 start_codon:yes stop_codon:yes gene_type:complete
MLDKLKQLKENLKGGKSEKNKSPNVREINDENFVVRNTNEFIYLDGSKVGVGTRYHIHINNINKEDVIMTGESHNKKSERILQLNGKKYMLSQYILSKGKAPKYKEYYTPYSYSVSKKHRKLGFSYRYFVKELFGASLDFEINDVTYGDDNPLYERIKIKWDLDTNINEMSRKNIESMETLTRRGYQSSVKTLNPTQGYLFESQVDKELQTQKKVGDLNKKIEPTNQAY